MLLRAVLIGNVGVVQKSIQCLDSRDLDAGVLSELDGRSKKSLNLQRSTGRVVLIHGAWRRSALDHCFHGVFAKVFWKHTALSSGKCEKFVNDTNDQSPGSSLLQELGKVWCFEEDTDGIKGNRSVMGVLVFPKLGRGSNKSTRTRSSVHTAVA